MHILSRIELSQDPWEKVALLSLQQLTEDVCMNQKRVRALEKSVTTLTETLVRSNSLEEQDLAKVTEAFHDLSEEISVWSTRSLERAEELVRAVQHLLASQQFGPALSSPPETTRLAS